MLGVIIEMGIGILVFFRDLGKVVKRRSYLKCILKNEKEFIRLRKEIGVWGKDILRR